MFTNTAHAGAGRVGLREVVPKWGDYVLFLGREPITDREPG